MDTLIGSLQFGSFGIGRALAGDPAMGGLLLPLDMPTPFSVGEPAGTNPSEGLLFWSGTALARDVSGTGTDGHAVIGGVKISIASYANPHANVSFFDLSISTREHRERNLGWTDVPVQDGAFSVGAESHVLQGNFFGRSHIGVGGMFRSDVCSARSEPSASILKRSQS